MSATTTSTVLVHPASSSSGFSAPMSLKSSIPPSNGSSSSTITATLRSLYPRAARALLHRDFSLTHSLITDAFAILPLPSKLDTLPDALDVQRRKWDILRITLDTTAYTSTGTNLPAALKELRLLTTQLLIHDLHLRSMKLFTPVHPEDTVNGVNGDSRQKGTPSNPSYVPPQILSALVFASLKLECAEVGRGIIEDWLARRDQVQHIFADKEVYAKVLEVYTLHVLPRLQEWEFAKDFLRWETELDASVRMRLQMALDALHTETIEATSRYEMISSSVSSPSSSMSTPTPSVKGKEPVRTPESTTPNGGRYNFSRSPSPSLSTSSSSSTSSMETTSTRTVVPHSRNGLTPVTPSAPSPSIGTSNNIVSAEPRAILNGIIPPGAASKAGSQAPALNGTSQRHSTNDKVNGTKVSNAALPPLQRMSASTSNTLTTTTSSSIMGVIQQHLSHWRDAYLTPSRMILALVLVIIPLFSFVLRVRRARIQTGSTQSVVRKAARSTTGSIRSRTSSVEDVKRRLGVPNGRDNESVFRTIWNEVIRAVSDIVKMGGSGLV